MPRAPRNPGSGKRPHNGPAQGAGTGGPANGAGWGGPSSGHAPDGTPQPFGPDNPAPARWRTPEELAARKAAREQDAAAAWDRLVVLMESPYDPTALAASQAVLARVEGAPVARNINATVEPSEILDTRPPVEDFLAEWTAKQDAKPTQH
jgi:hypothetical protein